MCAEESSQQADRLAVALAGTHALVLCTEGTKESVAVYSQRALVAQRIEYLTSDQRVGGSSPSEGTNKLNLRASPNGR